MVLSVKARYIIFVSKEVTFKTQETESTLSYKLRFVYRALAAKADFKMAANWPNQ
jgi:hypothetical protein